jgi:hypothetical protein
MSPLLACASDLAKQLNGLRFVARLARVGVWDDRFDFNSDDIPIRSDQPRAFDSFSGQLHEFNRQRSVP